MISRPKISKEEIIADALYLLVAMAISGIAIFIFDIHWSFYPGETVLPPSRHIFETALPYFVGIPIGGIVGFLFLKIVFFAFVEDERAHDVLPIKKSKKIPKK